MLPGRLSGIYILKEYLPFIRSVCGLAVYFSIDPFFNALERYRKAPLPYHVKKYVIPSLKFTALVEVPMYWTVGMGDSLARYVASEGALKFLENLPMLANKLVAFEAMKYDDAFNNKTIGIHDYMSPITKEVPIAVCKAFMPGPKPVRHVLCNGVGEGSKILYSITFTNKTYVFKDVVPDTVSKAIYKTAHQVYESVFVGILGDTFGFYISGAIFPRNFGEDCIKNYTNIIKNNTTNANVVILNQTIPKSVENETGTCELYKNYVCSAEENFDQCPNQMVGEMMVISKNC